MVLLKNLFISSLRRSLPSFAKGRPPARLSPGMKEPFRKSKYSESGEDNLHWRDNKPHRRSSPPSKRSRAPLPSRAYPSYLEYSVQSARATTLLKKSVPHWNLRMTSPLDITKSRTRVTLLQIKRYKTQQHIICRI